MVSQEVFEELAELFNSISGATFVQIPREFEESEWPLSTARAFDAILLNSVAVMWGVATALSEANVDEKFSLIKRCELSALSSCVHGTPMILAQLQSLS